MLQVYVNIPSLQINPGSQKHVTAAQKLEEPQGGYTSKSGQLFVQL